MNIEHLRAFLWLRWRIRVNQAKRAGTLNSVLTAILAIAGLVVSAALFVAGIVLGAAVMPELSSSVRLYVWDGIVLAFLFTWMIGLLADLQRSEGLALDKVLQLPVSPAGAYLVNYLSSFFSLTLVLFLPGMTGLILGQVYHAGAEMLLALPLLAAFVLAVTALTYQFQGWLSAMMVNPRRRRLVIVLFTSVFILLSQLPNLLNLIRPWDSTVADGNEVTRRQTELREQFQAGGISPEEYLRRNQEVTQEVAAARLQQVSETGTEVESITRLVNSVIPPGWLPLGAADLAVGHVLPALLGGCGLALIGVGSLWRGYRATVRMYTAGGTGSDRRRKVVAVAIRPDAKARMVEWRLPWVSEYASVVAMAGLRSLLRAPEAKMMLIVPVVALGPMAAAFFTIKTHSFPVPDWVGPLVAVWVVGFLLGITMQLAANLFGYDRDGFRAFVLSPAPRREILLGKNLALAPLILGLGALVGIGIGFAFGIRFDQILATLIQLLMMYLPYCLIGNTCAILAPFAVPSGSLKGARPGLSVVLSQLVAMIAFMFLVGLPGMIPAGVEAILAEAADMHGLPVSLVLSLISLGISVWIYRRLLNWQGRLLAEREQTILTTVTSRSD